MERSILHLSGNKPILYSHSAIPIGYHRNSPESGDSHRTMHMKSISLALALALFSTLAAAQDISSVLRPPKGSQLAIVVFEDLQCPMCRQDTPLLEQAAKTYRIPLVIHDFPLPMHNWSYDAAVTARYFDGLSKELGNQYRDYIFEHQVEIIPQNLRGFSDRFAADHKVQLPFVVDPQGKLAAAVNADRDLGKRIGLDHTPTIYLVNNKTRGPSYVEVKDRTQLFQMIDAMKAQ
jgi:protein-disulfide isomerase